MLYNRGPELTCLLNYQANFSKDFRMINPKNSRSDQKLMFESYLLITLLLIRLPFRSMKLYHILTRAVGSIPQTTNWLTHRYNRSSLYCWRLNLMSDFWAEW